VFVGALAVSFAVRAVPAAAQSLSYTKGQPVLPAYEGWEQDADGSKYFVFGYMNRNWEEELDIAAGADNGFDRGTADRGQPTHFLPRRNRFVFRVSVPAGFSEKDELVWTLTAYGKTTKAYASLRPDYKIDDVVKASETGALGAGTSSPTIRANKAPIVKLEGGATRTVKAGEPLSLVVVVKDDGVPKAFTQEELTAALAQRARAAAAANRGSAGASGANANASSGANASGGANANTGGNASASAAGGGQNAAGTGRGAAAAARPNPALAPPVRVTVGKNLGLHLSWFVYRGAGAVTFTPVQIKAWEDTRAGANSPWAPLWFAPPLPPDGRLTTEVVFKEPGTYVLRALADDGALTAGENVTVSVLQKK
jgi:hypothetical protein